jgi:hypothetical protein
LEKVQNTYNKNEVKQIEHANYYSSGGEEVKSMKGPLEQCVDKRPQNKNETDYTT